ncbi:hypothetical protein BSKO_10422 [Bryopsis sp. KO-2023]|nr:hypothetical protein BSKO_10422 [Bryopsis sp. KO-2023]
MAFAQLKNAIFGGVRATRLVEPHAGCFSAFRASWLSTSTDDESTSSGSVPLGEPPNAKSESPAEATRKLEDKYFDEIRARVFGYHIGNGLRSGRKVLRKKLVGERIVNYYLDPIKDPLMLNLKNEAAKLRLANLKRRGKGPPKKGQGKRTKK